MIRHPLNTEKSIRMMESDNKLVFVVDKNDTVTHVELVKEVAEEPDYNRVIEAAKQAK
jgi:ribosomal protein L23